eukprot:CAMPEP_0197615314 /NCGR_PEP_ID=MMETSP1326-20131121/59967_1 /TAXON_ID=1155430 /ORGANISM="Genus nov. species nov., Strain RCC2288" /LENGTH=174 /DNA_ID=CAMNT_0043184195 /DNA_START=303 /DNA_END=829 /DNA_ORIENTATION=-
MVACTGAEGSLRVGPGVFLGAARKGIASFGAMLETFPISDVGDHAHGALHLEEKHLDEGWEDGLREGEKLGHLDGREVGFAKGFEVGQELGFYAGCHAVWVKCVKEDPECFSERARKGIASFGAMLETFPISDPLNEEILETLNGVRGKFKTIVALLGMHHEYNPQETKLSLTF